MRLLRTTVISLIFTSTTIVAQVPITQVEGFLEVYLSEDTTSVYIGKGAGQQVDLSTRRGNTFVGAQAGSDNTTGGSNSFYGHRSGFSNTTGSSNSFYGRSTGISNTTGISNSFYGTTSGFSNTTGANNSFYGTTSGFSNTTGANNSFYGLNSGISNTSGISNSFFGRGSGGSITTQDSVIVIGAYAGPTFSGPHSNRLYIDVQESNDPLIYGEFDNDLLRINGRLQTKVEDAKKTYVGLYEESGGNLFGYELEYDGAEDKLHLWSRGFGGNEAKRMTWLKDGKVGIGKEDPVVELDVVGSINATGSINPSSDVNLKELFHPIANADILNKIVSLPITEWQYKASADRHIGPMAQDFYAAFGLGQGETTIATVDADGVALAAIQALAQENEILKSENKELKMMYADILRRLERIEETND